MINSDNKLFLVVILPSILLLCIGVKPATGSSCSFKTRAGYCAIENITIQTDADASELVFPNEKLMALIAPNIFWSWKILFSRIPNTVQKLGILDGYVPEVYIASTLYDFRAQRNLVREVIIDETSTYSLRILAITLNSLRTIPRNIGKLTNLIKLNLHGNEIDTVNMDYFKNLTNLDQLVLYGNRITRIDTTETLTLPKLAQVYLNTNNLENLAIELWNFTNLKKIHLNNNRLRMIQGFPEQFANINEISLGYNRWSCAWLEQSSGAIFEASKLSVITGEEVCSNKSFKGVCCEESLDDVKNSLAKLQRALERIDEKISKLTTTHNQTKEESDFFT